MRKNLFSMKSGSNSVVSPPPPAHQMWCHFTSITPEEEGPVDPGLQKPADTPSVRSVDANPSDPLDPPAVQPVHPD